MRISYYWTRDGRPKEEKTRAAIRLVGHTIDLIMNLQPRFWILENPRGMMRRVLGPPAVTTFHASWGMNVLKPTDLWGVLPHMKWPKPGPYEHVPRGSHGGVQRIAPKKSFAEQSALRALIPYKLSEAVCLACEKALNVHNVHECHAKETEPHKASGQPLS